MPQKDLTPPSNLLQHAAQVNPIAPLQLSRGNLPAYEILIAGGAIQHYLALRCLRPISRWSWALLVTQMSFSNSDSAESQPVAHTHLSSRKNKQANKQNSQRRHSRLRVFWQHDVANSFTSVSSFHQQAVAEASPGKGTKGV